ncbi:substrate-binding domain-containing protein [Pseudoroseicyclus tamaricis]|uniref:Cell envelope biogenesis protein OmpA n=1 Tax=Pseudoroseicyclus tamaricis TaxID=2705421 RepID=A0A6B2K2B5_9RHOB|nr:substrate-binding domain-containing protein [Pseudoroseicyclus tamaricis]NDV02684.1 cell envelope biogenesis protein OmpA [Pseudoroseicyclus tamaricis]
MRRPRGHTLQTIGAASFAALFAFAPAMAEEVTLREPGGGFEITGEFLGFDGQNIRINAPMGEMTLAYEGLACEGACPEAGSFVPELRLSGPARLAGLILPALVEAYARTLGAPLAREEGQDRVIYRLGGDTPLAVSLRATSTEDAFADLLAHEADMALADRPLTPMELSLARDAGLGPLETGGQVQILALDALVPVVSPGRAMDRMRLRDLVRIYSGELNDWADLGQPQGPITPYLAAEGDGQAQYFVSAFLSATGRDLSPGVQRLPAEEVAAAVAGEGSAVGLVPFGAADPALALQVSGPCGLSQPAEAAGIRTEDYPLTLPLHLNMPRRIQHPSVAAFLDWLAEPEAQLVLRRAGVIGQEPAEIPVAEQGRRFLAAIGNAGAEVTLSDLRDMADVLGPRTRLSPTFRFEEGDAALDGPSRASLEVLARRIADGRYAGRELLFVGFSDRLGPASRNLLLARTRAAAVEAALLEALGGEVPAGVTLAHIGLGEVLPVACDDTVWGRERNRRVELWLR